MLDGYWLPENLSAYGHEIDRLFYIILAITTTVVVVTESLLFWFLWNYRARPGRRALYTHGSTKVEIVWTAVPALILIVLASYGQRVWSSTRETPPADAFVVRVNARQFQWNMTYSGADGVFGTPDDFDSLGVMALPFGRPIIVEITSKDVIHSFFLPQFRVKQDAVPGITTRVWFSPERTGDWEIACAELCGIGHASMRGYLKIMPPDAFAAWSAETKGGS